MSNSRQTATASTGDRRYNDGEWQHPSEVSDPAVRDDETSTSRLTWLKQNKGLTAGLVIAACLVLLVLARFLPGIANNTYVRYGSAIIVLMTGVYVLGRRQTLHRAQNVDELVLHMGGSTERYYGTADPGHDDYIRFTPAKGFTLLGSLGDAYSIQDIDPELARMQQRSNGDPSEDAVIRVDPAFAGARSTETGTVISVATDGLSLDPFNHKSALKTSPPTQADVDALGELKDRIASAREEKRSLESRLQAERRRRKDAEEEAKQKRTEIMDEFTQRFREIAESQQPKRRRRRTETDSLAASTPTEEVMADVQDDD